MTESLLTWRWRDLAIFRTTPVSRETWCCSSRQCAWEKLAWPSRKNLLSEFMDMLKRITQLGVWSEDLTTPQCVWLPGLFNPTAYLTAVMQVRAQCLKASGRNFDSPSGPPHCSCQPVAPQQCMPSPNAHLGSIVSVRGAKHETRNM